MEEENILKTNTFQHKIKRIFAGWDEKGRRDGSGPHFLFLLLIYPRECALQGSHYLFPSFCTCWAATIRLSVWIRRGSSGRWGIHALRGDSRPPQTDWLTGPVSPQRGGCLKRLMGPSFLRICGGRKPVACPERHLHLEPWTIGKWRGSPWLDLQLPCSLEKPRWVSVGSAAQRSGRLCSCYFKFLFIFVFSCSARDFKPLGGIR